MPKPGEILEIDLDQDPLFGYEPRKNDLIINTLVSAIENGDPEFPPVPVHSADQGFFLLEDARTPDNRIVDGGHCRAVAHYIAGRPMKAKVVSEGAPPRYKRVKTPINIQDILLVDDDGEFEAKRKSDLNYAAMNYNNE